MRQIHLDTTVAFEDELRRLMRHKGIANECEAIRQAVHEATTKAGATRHSDFRSWLAATAIFGRR